MIVLLLLFSSMVLAACGQSESTAPAGSDGKDSAGSGKSGKKYAFVTSTLNNTFMTAISDQLKKEIEADGDTLVVLDPQYDQAKQNSMMQDAVTQGVDGIFLIAVDSQGVREGIQKAKDKKIPVIAIDNPVADTDLVAATVASDNYQAGLINGQQMAKDFPNGAKIAIIDFPEAQACVDRLEGFKKGLGDNISKFKIVGQQDGKASLEKSLPIAEDFIQANPDLQALFAINDPSALGAVAAFKSAGKLKGIKIYTVDGSPDGKKAFMDGEITLTVAQSPKKLATTSYEAMKKILAGETIEKKILVPTFAITKEFIEQNGGVDVWQ